MSRNRFFVVHNAAAGREAHSFYKAVLEQLAKVGCHVEVVETQAAGEGEAAALRASRNGSYDAVVAAGGDGTVHDVARGVLGSTVPLGLIPSGTTDGYSRELGLPREPFSLAHILREGPVRTLPVGEVAGQPFLFVVGVGFDADAVGKFEASGARRLGRFGVVWSALHALSAPTRSILRVKTESGEFAADWVIVTRAKRYAMDLMLAPDADLGSDLFHLLMMTGGRVARVGQLCAMAVGGLRHGLGVTTATARTISIESEDQVPVQIDGERSGRLPMTLKLHNKALTVIAPPQINKNLYRRT